MKPELWILVADRLKKWRKAFEGGYVVRRWIEDGILLGNNVQIGFYAFNCRSTLEIGDRRWACYKGKWFNVANDKWYLWIKCIPFYLPKASCAKLLSFDCSGQIQARTFTGTDLHPLTIYCSQKWPKRANWRRNALKQSVKAVKGSLN